MQPRCWEEKAVLCHSQASLLSFVLESIGCTEQCYKRHYCHLSIPLYMHSSKFNLPSRGFELKLLFCYLLCSNSIIILFFFFIVILRYHLSCTTQNCSGACRDHQDDGPLSWKIQISCKVNIERRCQFEKTNV